MLLGAILFATARLAAQQPDRPVFSAAECQLSAEVLTTGRSNVDFTAATGYPRNLSAAWSAGRARHCGQAGFRALASAMRRNARSANLKLLDQITSGTQGLLDRGIYTAATGIAENRAATPEARVFAIRTLVWLVDPGLTVTYSNLASEGLQAPRCFVGGQVRPEVQHGTPLPPDFRRRLFDLAVRVVQSPNEIPAVQSAANCLRRFAREEVRR